MVRCIVFLASLWGVLAHFQGANCHCTSSHISESVEHSQLVLVQCLEASTGYAHETYLASGKFQGFVQHLDAPGCSKQNCWARCFFHSFLHPIHLLFRRGWHKKHWHSSKVIQDTRDGCQPFSPYEVTHPQSPGLHDIEMRMTSGWGQRSDMGMIAYDLWDLCMLFVSQIKIYIYV